MAIWVGTSGYVYPAWRNSFYPQGLPAKQELAFASRAFTSIEINRSFYSLLTPAACRAWYEQTPDGFVFALKGSRFITHNKKLRDVDGALANFFASGPLALGDKLGPIVWQLPASAQFDGARLRSFFQALPKSTAQAAALARKHDHRVKHGAHLQAGADRPLRHVLEPRHSSFLTAECAALLREHNVALSITDSPSWPYAEEPTADFMYVRLHGSEQLYASQYSDAQLDHWAERARKWSRGTLPRDMRRLTRARSASVRLDVYIYFDNDAHAYAAFDAQHLLQRLAPAQPARPKPLAAVKNPGAGGAGSARRAS